MPVFVTHTFNYGQLAFGDWTRLSYITRAKGSESYCVCVPSKREELSKEDVLLRQELEVVSPLEAEIPIGEGESIWRNPSGKLVVASAGEPWKNFDVRVIAA